MGNLNDKNYISEVLKDLKENAFNYADEGKILMRERHWDYPGYHQFIVKTNNFGSVRIYGIGDYDLHINDVKINQDLYDVNELYRADESISAAWTQHQKKVDLSKSFFHCDEYEDFHIKRILNELIKNLDEYKARQFRKGRVHSKSNHNYYEFVIKDLGKVYLSSYGSGTMSLNGVEIKSDLFSFKLFDDLYQKLDS